MKRQRLSWLLLLLLALVVVGCDGEAEGPPLELSRLPIIGGIKDSGHPAVGAVQSDYSICTGTLISPRIVITAAHCSTYGPPKWFVMGASVFAPEKTHFVKKWIPHPQYGQSSIDGYYLQVHDIAIVVLTEPVTGVTPIKYRTASLVGKEGSSITFVGYGKSNLYDDNSSGEKYKVTTTIGKVNSQGFWNYTTPSNPKNTCVGDSGGPALMTVGGTEEVISVVSAGDENCTKDGWNIRTDIHASWIQGLIDTWDPGGVTAVCGNGYCEAGESATDCPADCSGGPDPGGLGAACSSPADCQTGMLCVQSTTGNFCTQYCSDPKGGTGCPAPYTCVPLASPPPSGEGVCYNQGTTASCGNGKCEAGETSGNCPADCGGSGECGTISYEGCCDGKTLLFCEGGKLQEYDCSGNPSCGWNSQAGYYDCGTGGGSDPSGKLPRKCAAAGPVCGDGKCEGGESQSNCPADCGTPGPVCGDGKCEGSESYNSCSADCPAPVCGDGKCQAPETSESCTADCDLTTQPVCGDGKCQAPETSESCPADCDLTTQPVCGDGKCQAPETSESCPADCDLSTSTECGNGYCEWGETPTKCPDDCSGGSPPECGNGYCEVGENADSCPGDCGGILCGDGKCQAPETSKSCPADCDLTTDATCGDGDCQAGESEASCPDDCQGPGIPVCGDGLCSIGEGCQECQQDCGFCVDLDGDGKSDASCSTARPGSSTASPVPVLLLLLGALLLLKRKLFLGVHHV